MSYYVIIDNIDLTSDIIDHEKMLGCKPKIFVNSNKTAIEVSGKIDYGIKPVKTLEEGWHESTD